MSGCSLAPGQQQKCHSNVEPLVTVSDLIGLGIEPKASHKDSNVF